MSIFVKKNRNMPLTHVIRMCILLCREGFFDAHVCKLPTGKRGIFHYCKFLPRFHLIEKDLNRVFDVVRFLHLVLILHEVSGHDFSIPNVHPILQLRKGLVRLPHHHVFFSLDPLLVDSCNRNFIEVTVHVLD